MTRDQTIAQIARQHLNLETLEARNSDSLDFSDQAVWSLKAALEAAYAAGAEASAAGQALKLIHAECNSLSWDKKTRSIATKLQAIINTARQ
jgi:hypothetical protein